METCTQKFVEKISSIRAAISTQYRRVTDRQTDSQTTTANSTRRASIASCGKKIGSSKNMQLLFHKGIVQEH